MKIASQKAWPTIFLMTMLCLSVIPGFTQQTAEQVYQQALFLEEAKGELEKAQELYQKVLNKYPENREVSAKAKLHLGICWEKLGDEKAKNIYQAIIQEYSDQKEVVSEAHQRLQTIRKTNKQPAPSNMTIKKVWEGNDDVGDLGEVSPDGKYISYVHWDTGDLAIYEIATGKKRLLTHKGSWDESDEYALESVWSPDSKKLAYIWDWGNTRGKTEIRIVKMDGSPPRTLCKTTDKIKWYQPGDWSPDGKHIIAAIEETTGTTHIGLITVNDGAYSIVKTLPNGYDSYDNNINMSPDGQFIAYNYPAKEDPLQYDIYIISSETGDEVSVIEYPTHEQLLGWCKNSDQLMFVSNRSGSPGIWSIAVTNGHMNGDAKLIGSTKGPNLPSGVGLTDGGQLYYYEYPNSSEVMTMEIDPVSNQIISEPAEAIHDYLGSNASPDYSPDGQYLAYISRRSSTTKRFTNIPVGNVLCIQSLETGKTTTWHLDIKQFGFPKWSPDGKEIMVANWENDNEHIGLYVINPFSGKAACVFTTKKYNLNDHAWGMDSDHFYIVYRNREKDLPSQILLKQISSDKTQLIYQDSIDYSYNIATSPDRRSLAIYDRKNSKVMITEHDGNSIKEIYSWQDTQSWPSFLTWSADGKNLIVPKIIDSQKGRNFDLWIVPINGDKPKPLGIKTNYVWQLSAHPNGKDIAIGCQGSQDALPKIWVMEHFLPSL